MKLDLWKDEAEIEVNVARSGALGLWQDEAEIEVSLGLEAANGVKGCSLLRRRRVYMHCIWMCMLIEEGTGLVVVAH